MRIIIFIVFIMMIIIFINELKNISSSFFQINYIKDVADINIKKHCNDIYCEAETGRFNIAKNSYKLLLPNDFYNTKTYYFMILLIIIIFYINTFYNFIKYNNLYYPYISNDGGTTAITIIKNIPYIFAFLTFVLIIAILIARYAPTETEGYRNYFNTDNPAVGEIHFLNINDMYNNVLYILALIFIVYYFCISICNPYIYTYPQEANKLATINKNMTTGYLIITIMLTYLLLNIMNILLSFADNKYPKLNNNNYQDIILKNYKDILINTLDAPTDDKGKNTNLFTRENILLRCYTNSLTSPDVKDLKSYGHDITNNDGDYGITVAKSTTDAADKIHAVLYSNINYIGDIDNANDYEIKNIKVNYYFRYVSPLIPHKKIGSLKDGKPNAKPRYGDIYNINYEHYKDLHMLEKIIDKYKNDGTPYDAYYMIDNIRIGVLKDTSILNKILILFDSYQKTPTLTPTTPETPMVPTKEDFEAKYKVLLDLLIYFSINEINYWIEYKRKEIYESNNLSNYDYINDTVVPDYEKHTILLNLIKYLKEQKANSKKIIDDAINNNKLDLLKGQLIREIEKYSNYVKTAAGASGNKKQFFGKEYNMLSNITEIKENFSADISYGSANTFYEQYFNISNNDTSAYDIEYKIGNYFVKNIKYLIYFIIMIIIIAIVLIIFLYRNEGASLMAFAYDVIMPLIILLIFVVYISLFMSFNTNYNLNVIYGLFDSSYKRDLNDMNNLIIPFIKLHSNNKDKYDNNYYDLYIITNVLASFLYSDDSYDTASKYKNAYHKHNNDKSIYSRDETVDYNEFKKYYDDQFTIINEEFKQDFATIDAATPPSNKNLRKLYEYIKKTIKKTNTAGYTITDLTAPSFTKDDYIKKFESQTDKIVRIILICLELFGNNKDAYKKMDFIKNNFYFEKDKNGNLIPHKFRFNQSVFDKIYKADDNTSYITINENDNNDIKIYVSNRSKKDNIKKIVYNYMKILSLFHYNYILSRHYKDIPVNEIKNAITEDAKDRGFGESRENYLHQYKNKRLISLISNTKSFDKKSFILASETFKYSVRNADNTDNAGDAVYVYTNIIETYKIDVSNISDNYLENVVKTICYQVDNRDVIMNEDVGSGSGGGSGGGSKIRDKNGDAHDNQVSILHKANQCISYDFATNYTANLIMVGIIYYMGLYNNKIF